MSRCLLSAFRQLVARQQRRSLLSQAYYCESEWESRRQSTSLNNINPYEWLNTLIIRSQSGQLTSAIDLDIAANAVVSEDQLLDIEDLLFRFRHSKNAVGTLYSTHYALCRAYLKFNQSHKLMNLLADRVNYGVFPDSFASNMLMDSFLKAGETTNAAKIACLLMQQEDFSLESSRWIMIYSCLKWLSHANPAEWVQPSAKQDAQQQHDDDDEVIFRIPFLKNHFNDQHFDLVEPEKLIGKTLLWTSDASLAQLTGRDEVYNLILNCKVMGAALLGHSTSPKNLLQSHSDIRLYRDVVDKTLKSIGDSENEVLELKTIDEDLLEVFEAELKTRLQNFEQKDIEAQKQLFAVWNGIRETRIKSQIERYLKAEKLKMIESKISDLRQKEQHVFFFENKEQLEKQLPPAPAVETSPKQTRPTAYVSRKVRKAQKAAAKAANLPSDDDYVVPEISGQLQKGPSAANDQAKH